MTEVNFYRFCVSYTADGAPIFFFFFSKNDGWFSHIYMVSVTVLPDHL